MTTLELRWTDSTTLPQSFFGQVSHELAVADTLEMQVPEDQTHHATPRQVQQLGFIERKSFDDSHLSPSTGPLDITPIQMRALSPPLATEEAEPTDQAHEEGRNSAVRFEHALLIVGTSALAGAIAGIAAFVM
ncbi:MAG: hypothetical protein AAFX99_22135 [Myxococcota bacterium]